MTDPSAADSGEEPPGWLKPWAERLEGVAPAGLIAMAVRYERFLRFVVVGVFNTVFGYSIYAALYLAGMDPKLAIIIATIVGVNFNFFTTGRLVFDNRSWRKLVPFWIGYGVALLVNLAMAEGLLRLGVHPLLTQALCLPVFVMVAYLVNAKFVFARRAG